MPTANLPVLTDPIIIRTMHIVAPSVVYTHPVWCLCPYMFVVYDMHATKRHTERRALPPLSNDDESSTTPPQNTLLTNPSTMNDGVRAFMADIPTCVQNSIRELQNTTHTTGATIYLISIVHILASRSSLLCRTRRAGMQCRACAARAPGRTHVRIIKAMLIQPNGRGLQRAACSIAATSVIMYIKRPHASREEKSRARERERALLTHHIIITQKRPVRTLRMAERPDSCSAGVGGGVASAPAVNSTV